MGSKTIRAVSDASLGRMNSLCGSFSTREICGVGTSLGATTVAAFNLVARGAMLINYIKYLKYDEVIVRVYKLKLSNGITSSASAKRKIRARDAFLKFRVH